MTARVTQVYVEFLAHGAGVRNTQAYVEFLAHGGDGQIGLTIPTAGQLLITTSGLPIAQVNHQANPDKADLIITSGGAPEIKVANDLIIITYPPDAGTVHFFEPPYALLEIITYIPEVEICRVWIRELPDEEYPMAVGDWELDI